MPGKYRSLHEYWAARLLRAWVRWRIRGLVSWRPAAADDLEDGCTVVIGMCSKLPKVLLANLTCLARHAWPGLRQVLVCVDAVEGTLAPGFEDDVVRRFPELRVRFFHYTPEQSRAAEWKLHFTHVYGWTSWTTCLSHVTTRMALIHDYDALVVGDALPGRCERFRESGAKVQGIRWYEINGFHAADRLASTFECLVDVAWIRSHPPIRVFSRVGRFGDRIVDYDLLLDLQANHLDPAQRACDPMDLSVLVHPSQMIKQYTSFRKFPGKRQPCYSAVMIPFFHLVAGQEDALRVATEALRSQGSASVDLLGDGVLMNLGDLETAHVDWMLKQACQASLALGHAPSRDLLEYGTELYRSCGTPEALVWKGDFEPDQRAWIEAAQAVA